MASTPLKYIALIEIAHGTQVYNRTLLVDDPIKYDDLLFYYQKLLGFGTSTSLSLEHIEVPYEFNASLLADTAYAAPTDFPAHDVATDASNTAHREKYKDYIKQLCEMERSRVSLNFFQKRGVVAAPVSRASVSKEETYVHDYIHNRRTWVDEILEALNAENECETDAIALRKIRKEYTPAAWIVTPSITSVRTTRGSRIIFDTAIGKYWENLLGTQVFPDLLVSRRLTTITWTFQHATADAMLDAMLKWYIASQGVTIVDGISDFIIDADKEISSIINAVKKIKVAEQHMTLDPEIHSDASNAVYLLLAQVEAKMLASASTDATISQLPYETFVRFMTYVYKAEHIPKEAYYDNAGVTQILTRWVRCNLGFRADAAPINGTWNTIWMLIMRDAPSLERINHFLATMDSWDPLLLNSYSKQDRHAIAQEWMRVYVDTQLVHDPHVRIKSLILYEHMKEFCGQYLPMNDFNAAFSISYIGQVLTRKGLTSSKMRNGRYTLNVRFLNYVPDSADAVIVESATPAPPRVKTGSSVRETVVAATTDSGAMRIEQFFMSTISTATNEIHLGTM
jgi:hypothetical protein